MLTFENKPNIECSNTVIEYVTVEFVFSSLQVSSIQASKEQLDDVAEDAIERLVESKEYISAEKIEKLVLQHYSIASLQEIQGVRRLEDIPIINAHVRKQCKANAYIQVIIGDIFII